jgi:hypothetical protein
MMEVLITFVLTTGVYVTLLVLVLRRVAKHLQGNEAATKAVTEHVLVPILGRAKKGNVDEPPVKRPVPREARLV